MSETRQQRRARARDAAKEKIKPAVAEGVRNSRSVHDLWKLYEAGIIAKLGGDQGLTWPFREAFYCGAAAVFELVTRVAPESVSEDEGARMLQRIEDELVTFARSMDGGPVT